MIARRAVAVALVAFAAAAQAAPPPPPPGVPASRVRPVERPPVPFDAALAAIGEPERLSAAPVQRPAPGSAAETVAVRRYVRGRQRALDGQPSRAAEDIDAALRLDPASAVLRSARAELALAGGDPRRSVAEWEAALALAPDDPRAQVAVGLASIDAGRLARGAALLGRAWKTFESTGFDVMSPDARLTIGSALARCMLRLGFDEAGLEVSAGALAGAVPDGGAAADPRSRAQATLARDAGEAAFRVRRVDEALDLLSLSAALVPDAGTVALLAYGQLLSGDDAGARRTVGALLAEAPWRDEELTVLVEWLLGALGGDRPSAESLAMAAYSAGPGRFGELPAPAERRARIARLLVAAGDAEGGRQAIDDAVDAGALDPTSLATAFAAAGDRAASRALAIVQARPDALRDTCRSLVASARDLRTLCAQVDALGDSPFRAPLSAGVMAACNGSGDAWRRAEDALDAATQPAVQRAALEAMLLAAVAAGDPSLVARAAADAPGALEMSGAWHASLARAYADTGAAIEAQQSIARAELRGLPTGDAGLVARTSLAEARATVDGRAPEGSPRGRAEAALSMGNPQAAVGELMMARATAPFDAGAIDLLLRILPRTDGPRATSDWVDGELARRPNDPLAWRAYVRAAIAGGAAAEALARVDERLAADPDDTLLLPGREELLRAAGRTAEALAAARQRVASLPAGPRRSLEEAAVELQSGNPPGAAEALARFAESAFPPPSSMRATALDLARRLPAALPARSTILRDVARDAVLTDPDESLEFYAFECLGAATEPGIAPAQADRAVRTIASEASDQDALRLPAERWRAAADFLFAQGAPRAAAEFLRARLEDPSGLSEQELSLLARAAVACDGAVGGRADAAMSLAAQLRSAGHRAFGEADGDASDFVAVAGIFELVGDAAGSERILEAGLAVEPDSTVLLNNLGWARLARGEIGERTASLIERAVELKPDEHTSLDTLGWLRYAQGRFADGPDGPGAVTLISRAIEKSPGAAGAEVHDHLGDARWCAGDGDGARTAWQEAVRLAEAGLDREQNIEVLRRLFLARVGLASIDAVRYHETHDGAIAARARAKLEAVARGARPEVAPSPGAAKQTP